MYLEEKNQQQQQGNLDYLSETVIKFQLECMQSCKNASGISTFEIVSEPRVLITGESEGAFPPSVNC